MEQGSRWMHSIPAGTASSSAATAAAAASDAPISPPSPLRIHSHWFHSEVEYVHAMKQSLSAITVGESYEVCLTNQLDITLSPFRKRRRSFHNELGAPAGLLTASSVV